jgi:hypothetical protein
MKLPIHFLAYHRLPGKLLAVLRSALYVNQGGKVFFILFKECFDFFMPVDMAL